MFQVTIFHYRENNARNSEEQFFLRNLSKASINSSIFVCFCFVFVCLFSLSIEKLQSYLSLAHDMQHECTTSHVLRSTVIQKEKIP